MTILFPVLAVILFLASLPVLGVALAVSRTARRNMEQHVNFVAKVPGKTKRRSALPDSVIVQTVGERLRSLLMIGIPYRWGVRFSPLLLLAIACGGMIASWILLHLLLRFSNFVCLPVAVISGFVFPHLMLRIEQSRSAKRFLDVFPDAVDMIVRMLRAGLPVAATMRAVGREAGVPVGSVFKTIADGIEIGVPFEDALVNASEAVGLPDFQFFAVAVALQRSTGGNLATTLEILCDIIRRRRGLRLKAKAATAEVRISAYVLGAMPIFVIGALLVVSPNYLTPLIRDSRGNILVAISLLLLFLGFGTMRIMMKSATRL